MGYEMDGVTWCCNGCQELRSEEKGDFPGWEDESLTTTYCPECVQFMDDMNKDDEYERWKERELEMYLEQMD